MVNQWGMLWNIINYAQQWRTSTRSETIQTILNKNEPVKHEVKKSNYPIKKEAVNHEMKQYKSCPVRMNRWCMTWNNPNHA